METGTTRARLDRDPDQRFVALRRALGVSTFGLNEIVLRPGERGRIHRHHRQEEVYLVLEGRLSVIVEGEETALEPDEALRVGPEVRRQLVNYGPATVVMLALGGDGEHAHRDGEAFERWEDETGSSPREIPNPEDLPADQLRG